MTINTNMHITVGSFVELGKSIGKPMASVNALKRAEKFDEIFKSYTVIDDVAKFERHDGSILTFAFIEALLATPKVENLPKKGNGHVDTAIDGAADTEKSPKTAAVKYLQTAEEYKNSTINNTDLDLVSLYDQLRKVADSKDPTKQKLLDTINNVLDTLLPTDKLVIYTNMLNDELETDKLKQLGLMFPAKKAISIENGVKVFHATVSWDDYKANFAEIIRLTGLQEPLKTFEANSDGELISAPFTFTMPEKD